MVSSVTFKSRGWITQRYIDLAHHIRDIVKTIHQLLELIRLHWWCRCHYAKIKNRASLTLLMIVSGIATKDLDDHQSGSWFFSRFVQQKYVSLIYVIMHISTYYKYILTIMAGLSIGGNNGTDCAVVKLTNIRLPWSLPCSSSLKNNDNSTWFWPRDQSLAVVVLFCIVFVRKDICTKKCGDYTAVLQELTFWFDLRI